MNIEVWKHSFHSSVCNDKDFCEFYLKGGDRVINVFKVDESLVQKAKWIGIVVNRVLGNQSDPLSFLLLVGKSVEEVWKITQDYQHIAIL